MTTMTTGVLWSCQFLYQILDQVQTLGQDQTRFQVPIQARVPIRVQVRTQAPVQIQDQVRIPVRVRIQGRGQTQGRDQIRVQAQNRDRDRIHLREQSHLPLHRAKTTPGRRRLLQELASKPMSVAPMSALSRQRPARQKQPRYVRRTKPARDKSRVGNALRQQVP